MTPNRRLDQLEPLMADSLQKIDRLIEGQGQIIEIATRADQNADTAARGVANLTISTQRQFDELRTNQERFSVAQEELRASQERFLIIQNELKTNQEQFAATQDELITTQKQFAATQEELKTNQERFSVAQDELRVSHEELKASHQELRIGQEKLSIGQDLILQILREKLP